MCVCVGGRGGRGEGAITFGPCCILNLFLFSPNFSVLLIQYWVTAISRCPSNGFKCSIYSPPLTDPSITRECRLLKFRKVHCTFLESTVYFLVSSACDLFITETSGTLQLVNLTFSIGQTDKKELVKCQASL